MGPFISSQVKPSVSSCAARAAFIPLLGSPQSSFFLNARWLLYRVVRG
jgi:hypothetical protein